VREEVVRERDRLRPLQVRVARHQRVHVLARAFEERGLEIVERVVDRVDRVEREEAERERDLVVAAAGGVERAGHLAEPLAQAQLDGAVDVFGVLRPDEAAVGQLARDDFQSAGDTVGVVGRDDRLALQHVDVRERASDVVQGEALILLH
jgi:hypothetical protein